MRVIVSTLLDCSPQTAWQEVQTTRLLTYITRPMVAFQPIDPPALPDIWEERTYLMSMRVFGFLPFGKHAIVISKPTVDSTPGKQVYEILDDGYGDVISRWHHRITIRETADGRTEYTDNIEVKAGLLTLGVWLYASVFYRVRQSRWRRLVRNNFDYSR